MTTIIDHSSPSSIHKLPAEILVQVFEELTALDACDDHIAPSSLFVCSRVDRRWNGIASTPSLYTQIHVPLLALRQQEYDAGKWARSWLERSGSRLIDLNVRIHGEIYREIDQFYALSHSLVQHASRLRSFSITVSDDCMVDTNTPIFLNSFHCLNAPALEEIKIYHTERAHSSELRVPMRDVDEPVSWGRLFWSTPKLRRVRFLGVATTYPLKDLTVIELQNVVLDELVLRRMAMSSPDLQELTLRRLHIPSPVDPGSVKSVPMPSLQSLSLGFDLGTTEDLVDRQYKYVLTRIEAPNLEYLELDASELLTGISNVLPPPSSLPGLRRISFRHLGNRLSFETEYVGGLRKSRIEDITLIDTEPDALGLDSSASKRDWENLKSLSIDTDDAKDFIWLCQVLVARPQVQTVSLSPRALRQLRENVVMMHFNENLTWVGTGSHLGLSHMCQGDGIYDQTEEWISNRVTLKMFE
ncbi:hypothetical protein E1B28_013159 [Marasmius oreades]|uniref:F-box domain-containing protein n=1 Tax=Marasmius oreades TaxID=181124 RepID=A0A9P7RQE6_9AGAR|nr:uncharacterized protein E1B28_013159 [Marasmius oreades]KAG7087178.1 hypothetical protein E1B28_013159 [Marasmius oreades]